MKRLQWVLKRKENKTFEKETFKETVKNNVRKLYRKTIEEATPQQLFQGVSYAIKDVIFDDWFATQKAYDEADAKTVYYMSMEFLMGRALGNNLINMTVYKEVKEALDEMGTQRLETEVSEDLRRASLIPLLHSITRHTAAVSATAMVCSSRRSRTATR